MIIDAVENSDQIRRALPQDAFETEALLGGHDLLGVGGADGGDLVGKQQPAFEKVDVVVIFEKLRREVVWIEIQKRPESLAEDTLEAEIVDRKDDFCRGNFSVARGLDSQKDCRESGLPVVAMHDVGGMAAQDLERGAAEKNKTLGVVGIIAARRAVEKFAIEVWIGANQVDRYFFTDGCFENGSLLQAVGKRHRKRYAGLPQRKISLHRRAICRRHDADFVAEPLQGDAQRADDVSQASGLGQGSHLRRDHGDVHFRLVSTAQIRAAHYSIIAIARRHSPCF